MRTSLLIVRFLGEIQNVCAAEVSDRILARLESLLEDWSNTDLESGQAFKKTAETYTFPSLKKIMRGILDIAGRRHKPVVGRDLVRQWIAIERQKSDKLYPVVQVSVFADAPQ